MTAAGSPNPPQRLALAPGFDIFPRILRLAPWRRLAPFGAQPFSAPASLQVGPTSCFKFGLTKHVFCPTVVRLHFVVKQTIVTVTVAQANRRMQRLKFQVRFLFVAIISHNSCIHSNIDREIDASYTGWSLS
jgi:hypothetical protein